ncbi:MAG: protein kinase, partial [Polyangiaceae bacterium]
SLLAWFIVMSRLRSILVGYDGVAKVLDFGVAKVAGRTAETTGIGHARGKPPYMAPEQALGHSLDRRADIFSLGIVLYQLVAERHPFPRRKRHRYAAQYDFRSASGFSTLMRFRKYPRDSSESSCERSSAKSVAAISISPRDGTCTGVVHRRRDWKDSKRGDRTIRHVVSWNAWSRFRQIFFAKRFVAPMSRR